MRNVSRQSRDRNALCSILVLDRQCFLRAQACGVNNKSAKYVLVEGGVTCEMCGEFTTLTVGQFMLQDRSFLAYPHLPSIREHDDFSGPDDEVQGHDSVASEDPKVEDAASWVTSGSGDAGSAKEKKILLGAKSAGEPTVRANVLARGPTPMDEVAQDMTPAALMGARGDAIRLSMPALNEEANRVSLSDTIDGQRLHDGQEKEKSQAVPKLPLVGGQKFQKDVARKLEKEIAALRETLLAKNAELATIRDQCKEFYSMQLSTTLSDIQDSVVEWQSSMACTEIELRDTKCSLEDLKSKTRKLERERNEAVARMKTLELLTNELSMERDAALTKIHHMKAERQSMTEGLRNQSLVLKSLEQVSDSLLLQLDSQTQIIPSLMYERLVLNASRIDLEASNEAFKHEIQALQESLQLMLVQKRDEQRSKASIVEDLHAKMEIIRQGRLEAACCFVMRMQRSQLGSAFGMFIQLTTAVKKRRERMDKLVKGMLQSETARAFDGLREGVGHQKGRKMLVEQAMRRLRRPMEYETFEKWRGQLGDVGERRAKESHEKQKGAVTQIEKRILELRETVECRNAELSIALIMSKARQSDILKLQQELESWVKMESFVCEGCQCPNEIDARLPMMCEMCGALNKGDVEKLQQRIEVSRQKRLDMTAGNAVRRLRHRGQGMALRQWITQMQCSRVARRAAMRWSRKATHMACSRWREVTSDGSWRRRRLNRQECVISTRVRRWQRQGMDRAWGSWYEHHLKRTTLKRLSRHFTLHWIHKATSKAWSRWDAATSQLLQKRMVVTRVTGRWQRPVVEDAFEQWLETLLESKRLSDLDERDMRIVELEGDMSQMQQELESWVKMESFVCEGCQCPNEIDARLPMMCEMCGALNKGDVEKLQQRIEVSRQKRLDMTAGNAMRRLRHRGQGMALRQWITQMQCSRVARRAAMRWSRKATHMACSRWREVTSDGSWRRRRLNRQECVISTRVRRWQRQGMDRAWGSWYEHHLKRTTLKRLSRHFTLHWIHKATSKAWSRWDAATSQLLQKRMVVTRVTGRWQRPVVEVAFEQWLETLLESKRLSDLDERDMRIVELEGDMSQMQQELESWVKMESFVCEGCQCPNEIDARLPMMCEMCGALNKGDVEKLQQRIEVSRQKRLDMTAGNAMRRLRHRGQGMALRQWITQMQCSRVARRAAMRWSRKATHMACSRWREVTSDGSWRRRRLNRQECVISTRVRRWQRQGMDRAWGSWYEHHLKRTTLKRLSRHFTLHWIHKATSKAWSRWDAATSQLLQKRMVVTRVTGRWQRPVVEVAFEQWLETLLESKRLSDLDERDMRIVELEGDVSQMQQELESWVKMESFVCEGCQCPNEIDARLPMMCEMCGALNKGDVERLQQRIEVSRKRMLESARCVVLRMQRGQLGLAFGTFVELTTAAKKRRERMDKLVKRMLQSETARAFDGLREGAEQQRGRRTAVGQALGLFRRPIEYEMFDIWSGLVVKGLSAQHIAELEASVCHVQFVVSNLHQQVVYWVSQKQKLDFDLRSWIEALNRREAMLGLQNVSDSNEVAGSQDSDRSIQYLDSCISSLLAAKNVADEVVGHVNQTLTSARVREGDFMRFAHQSGERPLILEKILEYRYAELSVALILSEERRIKIEHFQQRVDAYWFRYGDICQVQDSEVFEDNSSTVTFPLKSSPRTESELRQFIATQNLPTNLSKAIQGPWEQNAYLTTQVSSENVFVCEECSAINEHDAQFPPVCQMCGYEHVKNATPVFASGDISQQSSRRTSAVGSRLASAMIMATFVCQECGSENEIDNTQSLICETCGKLQTSKHEGSQTNTNRLQERKGSSENHEEPTTRHELSRSEPVFRLRGFSKEGPLHHTHSELKARDWRIQQLQTEVLQMQQELESWVKMESFVCEECQCPNEIDARLPMMCEMCGALNKSDVEKLQQKVEEDRQRRLVMMTGGAMRRLRHRGQGMAWWLWIGQLQCTKRWLRAADCMSRRWRNLKASTAMWTWRCYVDERRRLGRRASKVVYRMQRMRLWTAFARLEHLAHIARSASVAPGSASGLAVTLKLELDFSMAGREGSRERRSFQKQVVDDLAFAAGCSSDCFRVQSMSAGSTIIRMIIDTVGVDDEDLQAGPSLVLTTLQTQMSDENSRLRSGVFTSKTVSFTASEFTSKHLDDVNHKRQLLAIRSWSDASNELRKQNKLLDRRLSRTMRRRLKSRWIDWKEKVQCSRAVSRSAMKWIRKVLYDAYSRWKIQADDRTHMYKIQSNAHRRSSIRQMIRILTHWEIVAHKMRQTRMVVAQAMGPWQRPVVEVAFEQWLETLLESKRLSDLDERDMRIVELEGDMSQMQQELESWVKMESFVCEGCQCPNEIDARLPMMCEMCGALNKGDVEKLQQRIEVSRQKRLDMTAGNAMRRLRHRCQGMALRQWITQMQRSRVSRKSAMRWSRKATHMACSRWREVTSDGSWRRRRLNRQECVISTRVRRWQRQGMDRAWGSWYEHHLKRTTLKRLSRHFTLHWIHKATSKAWSRWDAATSQLLQKRMVVTRVTGRWQRPVVEDAFEQWLETLLESKRLSDLDERDMRIVELEGDMSQMQQELESWVKMESFVCEECQCPNEIDARLPMMCEMCGALNKGDVERLQQRIEVSRKRRLESARCVVLRMQRGQLGLAFGTFVELTTAAKKRRERMDKLVKRMLQSETARAFDGLREGAEQQRGRRTAVGQAVERWQRPVVEDTFEQWQETLLESKRLSDLDERDMRIVELEGDMSQMQQELESWVKMESFVCEECQCPNEIDARLPMMCEMCGALNKGDVERLQQRIEVSRKRRLESARCVVLRMQRGQLGLALRHVCGVNDRGKEATRAHGQAGEENAAVRDGAGIRWAERGSGAAEGQEDGGWPGGGAMAEACGGGHE
jgi:hypothetical protein